MGILSDVQGSLSEAFDNDLSDVVVSFSIIKSSPSGAYNTTTGTRTVNTTQVNSRGVFNAVPSHKLKDSNVKSTDELLIVIASEISVSIDIDDEITTSDNSKYLVISQNPVLGGGSTPIIYEAIVRKNA